MRGKLRLTKEKVAKIGGDYGIACVNAINEVLRLEEYVINDDEYIEVKISGHSFNGDVDIKDVVFTFMDHEVEPYITNTPRHFEEFDETKAIRKGGCPCVIVDWSCDYRAGHITFKDGKCHLKGVDYWGREIVLNKYSAKAIMYLD
nr:MAG TPA: hypothetical protein [Caudoviricetes sp.]